ncbi:Flp pilus assembly protein TadB [Mycobacterium sp. JS623]|uniref:type II secretion system F family protein n=1 Tax=Mycobacterium sp. JS623 TaxID=212767 RepID=UPI0002A5547D|nr:type II secretion system F family protein [Mycobacterium sp. JS623]AGB26133.1 Flp pilus assembly protein TadB [Mycobacterium sp. JS623]
MSAALLALALALVVFPASSRGRIQALGLAVSARRRPPALPFAGVSAAMSAIVLPAGLVATLAIVGGTWWTRRRRHLRAKRRAAESTALQGALEVLVGELRAGAHPVAAFSVAATEVDGPVAESLRAVAARARLGADVPSGLRGVAAGSALPAHWERLGVCWQLAQDHGLSIAPLMQTAQQDVVERERFSARVDAGMTGARTTAVVLAGLPLLGIGLGELIGAAPLSFLLSNGVGGWLLVIGIALVCAGMLWSDRITARASV